MRRKIVSTQYERALTLAARKQLLMLCGVSCSNIFPMLTMSRLNSQFSFTSSSSQPSAAAAAAVTPAKKNFFANNFLKSSTLNSQCHASANHKISNSKCNSQRLQSQCATQQHYKQKQQRYQTQDQQRQQVQIRTNGTSVLSKQDLQLIVTALRNQRSVKSNSEDSTNNSNCDEGADVKQSIMGGPGMGTRHGDMLAAFTCGRCDYRMVKKFSKHAYTKGIVIVQCPNCHVKHLLADHLGWLEDKPWTIEDLLREKNEKFVQLGEGCFEV